MGPPRSASSVACCPPPLGAPGCPLIPPPGVPAHPRVPGSQAWPLGHTWNTMCSQALSSGTGCPRGFRVSRSSEHPSGRHTGTIGERRARVSQGCTPRWGRIRRPPLSVRTTVLPGSPVSHPSSSSSICPFYPPWPTKLLPCRHLSPSLALDGSLEACQAAPRPHQPPLPSQEPATKPKCTSPHVPLR